MDRKHDSFELSQFEIKQPLNIYSYDGNEL